MSNRALPLRSSATRGEIDELRRHLPRPLSAWPTWALAAGGVALAVVLLLAFTYYVWIGFALLIVAILALAAFWAWFELPDRYEEGPDRAELAAQARWSRMMGDE